MEEFKEIFLREYGIVIKGTEAEITARSLLIFYRGLWEWYHDRRKVEHQNVDVKL